MHCCVGKKTQSGFHDFPPNLAQLKATEAEKASTDVPQAELVNKETTGAATQESEQVRDPTYFPTKGG